MPTPSSDLPDRSVNPTKPDKHSCRLLSAGVTLLIGILLVFPGALTAGDEEARNIIALRQTIAELESRIETSPHFPPRKGAPGALPEPSPSWEEARLAMVALQAGKAGDYLDKDTPDAKSAQTCIALARWAWNVKANGTLPGIRSHGALVEHAFFARNDRSPQPYFVYAPSKLIASKTPQPLLVLLHGWVPDTCRTNPWLPPDEVIRLADGLSTMILVPHGRTNTDFQYAGEVDVIRAIREMRKFYPVDENRIYLVGPSMGGAGVWQIAMHYPGMFAGIAPINAQGDWFRFWHEHFDYPVKEELPGHVTWLLSMHDPVTLATNLRGVFSYSQHATKCFVGVEHTRSVVGVLKKHGIKHEFFEDPSSLGHFTYMQRECWERSFRKVLTHKRIEDPRHIGYRTYSLRFPGAHWARITGIQNWGREATLDATREKPGSLILKTTNVSALRLVPDAKHSGTGGVYSVTWNGKLLGRLKPRADGSIVLNAPATPDRKKPVFLKNPAVCGPASDVFNFPFVAVYGTTGSEQARNKSKALASQFASDWHGYAEGKITLLADKDVDDVLISSVGLVLFGPPESNTLIRRVSPHLPFILQNDSIALPGGKRFSGDNLGYVLTYPNPLAPDRYILIYNGAPWGAGRSKNHKFDLLPDFCIFMPESIPGLGINRYLAAGLFDESWQYRPQLTDFPDRSPE
jgi:pimeloyl-ACP methyl ester carboxylesterase